jgi:beta-lactamase regulating signal transducer with metallopeptidase domain
MSLPYTLRLLCLCCASFFMIHLALAVATRLSAGTAMRVAERLKPSSAARLLFVVRMLPLTLTLFAVLAFCIPSYLWLEPEATGEKIGLVCFLTAVLGAAIWALAIVRVTHAVRGTARYLHRCERHGKQISMPGETAPALLLKDKSPVLAVAGVVHPRLVISRRVMRGLTAEQIDAALRHERAHRAAGDNLKRFLILLAPDVLPFLRGFVTLERRWAKAIEWAADDQASAGDPRRALSLADALVRVARMGNKPQLSYLSSSLMADDHDLSDRVDRLLRPQPLPEKPAKELIALVSGAAGLMASALAIVVLWPGSLNMVHQALEHLVR